MQVVPKPRILLGDDHVLIVEALRAILDEHFEVVGMAHNGRDLALEAQRLVPDVVLLDISMPLMNGIEAARQIKESVPAVHLLFLTQRTERAYIEAAISAGASGYLVKQSAGSELVSAIWTVLNGDIYLSASLPIEVPEVLAPGDQPVKDLTPREREILRLIAAGKTTEESAELLQISVRTVEFHKAHISERCKLRSPAELMRYAIKHGNSAIEQG